MIKVDKYLVNEKAIVYVTKDTIVTTHGVIALSDAVTLVEQAMVGEVCQHPAASETSVSADTAKVAKPRSGATTKGKRAAVTAALEEIVAPETSGSVDTPTEPVALTEVSAPTDSKEPAVDAITMDKLLASAKELFALPNCTPTNKQKIIDFMRDEIGVSKISQCPEDKIAKLYSMILMEIREIKMAEVN